jgi:hypothetical protein
MFIYAWTLKKKSGGRRQKEKKWNSLGMCGIYTLGDRIKNTVIRNELNIFNLNNIIRSNRFNWITHVERVEHQRIPKQLLDYTPRAEVHKPCTAHDDVCCCAVHACTGWTGPACSWWGEGRIGNWRGRRTDSEWERQMICLLRYGGGCRFGKPVRTLAQCTARVQESCASLT